MKFSQATLLAILATSTFVSAAPAAVATENTLVTRGDVNEVLAILGDLKQANDKRDFSSPEEEASIIAKRDSLLVDLVSAMESSGIIKDVWTTLTQDEALRTEIISIVKATIKAALVEGPTLIKAVFHSGIVGKIFKDILNDGDLRSVLFRVAKSIFSSSINLLKSYKSHKSSSTATATAVAVATNNAAAETAAATAATGSDIPSAADYSSSSSSYKKRAYADGDYLEKRDLASIVTAIAQQIKSSGLVSGLIKKVMANPEQSYKFLGGLLKKGFVLGKDLFSWAKSSGILEKGLQYMEKNGGMYGTEVASFLGGQIENGTVSASDIDNAGVYSGTDISSTAEISGATPIPSADAYDAAATTLKVRRSY